MKTELTDRVVSKTALYLFRFYIFKCQKREFVMFLDVAPVFWNSECSSNVGLSDKTDGDTRWPPEFPV